MAMAATAPAAACSCSLGRGRGDAKFNGLLTFVAVAKLGLHDKFGSADEASSSGRKLSVACSVAAEARHGSEAEEEQSFGDFCWLYSPLKMVGTASSRVPRRRGLTPKRKLQARAAVVGETRNGGLRDVVGGRWGSVVRETKETQVDVSINLDGTGICNCDTGIPFLDHMLDQLASHGLFDLDIKAKGDTHIDDHHTNEDVALALGSALLKALGDRKGITRFGNFSAPLDEALVRVVLDLSGRPFLRYEVDIPTQRVGTYDTQLVEHFFQSLANTSGMTLHIDKLAGKNSHHIIEATFKAFARALRQATEFDVRRQGTVPSSKGVLSRA